MIDTGWLADELVRVLRWHLAHPGGADNPDRPEVPWAGMRVWSIFLALNDGRAAGFSGPTPIAMVEIESYARLRRETLRPFELDMLAALDSAYMAFARDRAGGAATSPVSEPPSSESIFGVFRMAGQMSGH